jgi:2-polyprenyl-3-methyl-5-hydroxy-6-metoxy-1,4-benzoquinol methylase
MNFADTQISRVKEYWDQRPCNIRHSSAPIGSRQYFDEVEARKYFVEPHIPGFAQFDRWRGKKVLEIGCGIGTDTLSFARSGAQVSTVDLSEKSMELARARASVFGLQGHIRFYPGDAEELSRFVPVEPYDLIYSFGVIHHTPHPDVVLNQLRQYTRPGTTIKIMVYHRRSYKVASILLTEGRGQFWKLPDLVAKNSEAQTGCPVTYTYSRREGKQLLERHGFRVREVRVDHIFPYRIPDYVQYRYLKEPYLRWLPQPLFRALERRFGWHLLLTAEA